MNKDQSQKDLKEPGIAAWSVLVIGCLFTILTAVIFYISVKNRQQLFFELENQRVIRNINTRMSFYESALIQARAFLLSSRNVTENEFKNYLRNTELIKRYKGVLGLGYAAKLKAENLTEFTEKAQQEIPGFEVWPKKDQKVYYPIVYIVPQDKRNKRAIGYDMYSEKNRRNAMNLAMENNEATLSEKVNLVQDDNNFSAPGFNMYLPVYKEDAPTRTVEERKKALRGFIYSPFKAKELFDSISSHLPATINFSIYDGTKATKENLIYRKIQKITDRKHFDKVNINIANRAYIIHFEALPSFYEEFSFKSVYITLVLGFFGTFLFIIILLSKKRELAIETQYDASQLKLMEKENEFKVLANSIPQLAWMADDNGNIFWYNQRWYDYTGKSFQDMEGDKWQSVYHPDHLERFKNYVNKAFNKDEAWELTFPLLGKDGRWRWFLTRAVPIKSLEGKVLRWFGTNTDIDEQQVTSEKLKQSENRLQGIIHNMGEGLVLADSEGDMVLFNQAALKLHGFKNVDEIKKKLHEYPALFRLCSLESEEIPLEDWPISRVLRGERFTDYVVQIQRQDTGTKFYASYNGSPVYDDGKIILAILTLRDITYLIQAERDLKKAIKVRDDFLSVASHELKTPLTSLKLQTQSLIRKIEKNDISELTPDLMKSLLIKNDSQLNRLGRLVNDMLDLSRIESGKLAYDFTKQNLKQVVIDVCERFKEQFQNYGSSLACECEDDAWVMIDKERIEQVITNLLTNALKYGKNKPAELHLSKTQTSALIRVKDNGLGISEENFDKIFNKFERVVEASEVSGLGIGLFITKEMVEAHKGKIWVESKQGEGSTFHIEIPLS